MTRFGFLRASAALALWLLACLTFVACEISHTPAVGGSEAGNPPVVDPSRITVRSSTEGVVVAGEAGAVAGDAQQVEVRNISRPDAAPVVVTVQDDGSFEAMVEGTVDDEYLVSVVGEGAPGIQVSGSGTSDPDTALTCQQLQQSAYETVAAVFDDAVMGCDTDDDCRNVSIDTDCSFHCGALVAAGNEGLIQDAIADANDNVCPQAQAQGCQAVPPPCPPPLIEQIGCLEGVCGWKDDVPDPGTDPSPACTDPIGPGICDAAFPVYWHDPESGACVQRIWDGCTEGANNYETQADCRAACPAPSSCDAPRTLLEVCLSCGIAGGCGSTGTVCAAPCTEHVDCEGDGVGSFCVNGACQVSGCF